MPSLIIALAENGIGSSVEANVYDIVTPRSRMNRRPDREGQASATRETQKSKTKEVPAGPDEMHPIRRLINSSQRARRNQPGNQNLQNGVKRRTRCHRAEDSLRLRPGSPSSEDLNRPGQLFLGLSQDRVLRHDSQERAFDSEIFFQSTGKEPLIGAQSADVAWRYAGRDNCLSFFASHSISPVSRNHHSMTIWNEIRLPPKLVLKSSDRSLCDGLAAVPFALRRKIEGHEIGFCHTVSRGLP